MTSETLFVVMHTHTDPALFAGRSDKLIGMFTSESGAAAAIDAVSKLEGFVDSPEGFVIHPVDVDRLLEDPIEMWE